MSNCLIKLRSAILLLQCCVGRHAKSTNIHARAAKTNKRIRGLDYKIHNTECYFILSSLLHHICTQQIGVCYLLFQWSSNDVLSHVLHVPHDKSVSITFCFHQYTKLFTSGKCKKNIFSNISTFQNQSFSRHPPLIFRMEG